MSDARGGAVEPVSGGKGGAGDAPSSAATSASAAASAEPRYRALVIDSGAIIKHSAYSTLHNAAGEYYTVPAVLDEIRDAKAREHLQNLPFVLHTRRPSPEGVRAMSDFSRLTGDYRSLSSVDTQVLALLYDLEVEGCEGDTSHIRTTPKRTLGVGQVKALAPEKSGEGKEGDGEGDSDGTDRDEDGDGGGGMDHAEIVRPSGAGGVGQDLPVPPPAASPSSGPRSWATLVNPSAASSPAVSLPPVQARTPEDGAEVRDSLSVQFSAALTSGDEEEEALPPRVEGQFDDASEGDEEVKVGGADDDNDDYYDDDDRYADISDPDDISDEECEVYVLDPEEAEERKRQREAEVAAASADDAAADPTSSVTADPTFTDELRQDFPSLSAAITVPYKGGDDDGEGGWVEGKSALRLSQDAERQKQEALKPISVTKDGRLFNSFRKYGHVVVSSGISQTSAAKAGASAEAKSPLVGQDKSDLFSDEPDRHNNQSRILGGGASMGGKMTEEDDDGEGWITNVKEIRSMKASGRLDPSTDPSKSTDSAPKGAVGPPLSQRTACATTDFAMQNVILQMNLALLTVDGVKVRRLKSWVTRCGACFAVYTGDASSLGTNRLFCERCGSDFMQRVAASVDGKTGRLRLHLSKKYKNSTRGTKFSLPASGKGNRFEGDLLLREDQLMFGAWNQKVKKSTGKKEAQSIFGSDITSNVGCHTDLTKRDDIRVGFGRRNPNASKSGRERRGKKKKNSQNKACGLRRY